jgi:hypothetical protein
MPEGTTKILYKEQDKSNISSLLDSVRRMDVGEVYEAYYEDQELHSFSFEHSGSYSETNFTKTLKKAYSESGFGFLRAVHHDDYGIETFWLLSDNKIKKYSHNLDELEQSSPVVKAYRHWHSDLIDLWFGRISNEEIQVMSEMFGQYDENGKKVAQTFPDYDALIKSGKGFLEANIRAPYAASKWDYHIPVYESFARFYAKKSKFPVDIDSFKFERTYCFENLIGYVWSWLSGGKQVVLLLSLPGNNGMSGRVILNNDNLSINALTILDNFTSCFYSDGYDFSQHVDSYDPFSKVVIPSIDCLDDYYLGIEFDGAVLNIRCDLESIGTAAYRFNQEDGHVKGSVFDKSFCEWIDGLPSEKYSHPDERVRYNYPLSDDIEKKTIYCQLQAEFDENSNIRRVLKAKVKLPCKNANDRITIQTLAEWTK